MSLSSNKKLHRHRPACSLRPRGISCWTFASVPASRSRVRVEAAPTPRLSCSNAIPNLFLMVAFSCPHVGCRYIIRTYELLCSSAEIPGICYSRQNCLISSTRTSSTGTGTGVPSTWHSGGTTSSTSEVPVSITGGHIKYHGPKVHTKTYISFFLPTIFGPIYYSYGLSSIEANHLQPLLL